MYVCVYIVSAFMSMFYECKCLKNGDKKSKTSSEIGYSDLNLKMHLKPNLKV